MIPAPPKLAARIATLSPREREILRLVGRYGMGWRDIAARVGRSPKTIENQARSIYRKLRVNGIAALAVCSVRSGLADEEGPAR